MIPRPPRLPLFPYTTLCRSFGEVRHARARACLHVGRPRGPPERHAHGFRDGTGPCGSQATFTAEDRKSTRLNSSHSQISYAVFCLKKKRKTISASIISEPQS